jgi:hypothetical protein
LLGLFEALFETSLDARPRKGYIAGTVPNISWDLHHQTKYYKYFALKHKCSQKSSKQGSDKDDTGHPSVSVNHIFELPPKANQKASPS